MGPESTSRRVTRKCELMLFNCIFSDNIFRYVLIIFIAAMRPYIPLAVAPVRLIYKGLRSHLVLNDYLIHNLTTTRRRDNKRLLKL